MSTNTTGDQLTYAEVWATTGDVIEDAFARRRVRSATPAFSPPSLPELRALAQPAIKTLGEPGKHLGLGRPRPLPGRREHWRQEACLAY